MSEPHTKRLLLILTLVCFALRMAHVIFEYRPDNVSSWESAEIARNIVEGKGYSMKLSWGERTMPTAHMPPGVVFLLAFFYWTGVSHPHFWFLTLNALAAAATLPIVFSLARMAFSLRAAWIAVCLYLFDLNLSFTVTWVQETALNVFFTMAGLWSVCQAFSHWQKFASNDERTQTEAFARDLAGDPKVSRRWDFLCANLAGLSFGIGALIRPVILLVAAVAMLWFLVQKTIPVVARLRFVFTVTFLSLLLIAPWMLRNYVVFERVIPICQNWAINLWLGYSEGAGGSQCDEKGELHLPKGALAEQLKSADSELQIDKLLEKDALDYLKSNPVKALLLRPKCFLYFWIDHNYWLKPMKIPISSKVRIANYCLVALTFLGLLTYWRRPGIPRLFIAVMLVTSLFYTAFHADFGNRFRMPIEPLMIMFIAQLFSRMHSLVFRSSTAQSESSLV